MTHRVPPDYVRPPDPVWAERVEREALRQTDARQSCVEAAERRLRRVEAKLARRLAEDARGKEVRDLRKLVERRRAELEDLHREMTHSPAGAQHRGVGSHRHVATGGLL